MPKHRNQENQQIGKPEIGKTSKPVLGLTEYEISGGVGAISARNNVAMAVNAREGRGSGGVGCVQVSAGKMGLSSARSFPARMAGRGPA